MAPSRKSDHGLRVTARFPKNNLGVDSEDPIDLIQGNKHGNHDDA
jgi:hypothetical protein